MHAPGSTKPSLDMREAIMGPEHVLSPSLSPRGPAVNDNVIGAMRSDRTSRMAIVGPSDLLLFVEEKK